MYKYNLPKYVMKLLTSQREKSLFEEYSELYEKGEYRKAYHVLMDIHDRYPQHPRIGNIYLQGANLELIINDDIIRAKEYLDKVNESNCDMMWDYYRYYGYILRRMNENEKGIEYLEKSVQLNSTECTFIVLGQVLSSIKDKRALDIWKKVLSKNPNSCIAHIYLAREEYNSGNREKALQLVNKAKELNPTDEDYFELGRLYIEIREYQSAIDAYMKSDELGREPKGLTYAAISDCYFAMDQNNLAQKYIQLAMKYNPRSDIVKRVLEGLKEEGLDVETP
jgi:tetratricopeptide (TPR) repeat protein